MKKILSFLFFISLPFITSAESSDGREAILVPEKVRIQILADMRVNLETIQQVINALAREDFEAIEKAASKLGSMDHTEEMMQRRQLMPEGYRALGPRMHMGFQAIARDARDFGEVSHTLEQLSSVMSTCMACHQSYRLEATR
ncbi:MAG: hypothetical protein ABFS08_09055 [Pseudomonadota bacterium]